MDHPFTAVIKKILHESFQSAATDVFDKSQLLQYINIKTRSANRGSKARGSFANLYAIYVLVEDYISQGFETKTGYSRYEGAIFTKLFKRQRELPFGSKLQNHALNHRMNEEFRKYFPTCEHIPILRNVETNRYWINENLLQFSISEKKYNIASAIIKIVNEYIRTKRDSFERFIQVCEEIQTLARTSPDKVIGFISSLLEPNIDARVFEIVSYSILKYYYHDQIVYFGFDLDELKEENLKLYKTGRTNANDGGIDFVMKPLGRFFQVTETLDVSKYFLDIDKIERYPITFVIKSEDSIKKLKDLLKVNASKKYSVEAIVNSYIDCIEEIINIPILKDMFLEAVKKDSLPLIFDEIIKQSKVEFNYEDDSDDDNGDNDNNSDATE